MSSEEEKTYDTLTALDLMKEECELLEHRIEQAEVSDDPRDQEDLPKLKNALEYFVSRILDEMGSYENANIPARWTIKNKTVH